MNDQTRATLDRLMDDVPIGPAPIDTLLTAGRTAKHRKRLGLIGGAAAVMVVVMAGSGLAFQAVTGPSNNRVNGEPSPAAPTTQTHLVGIGGVAVAVPEDWGANDASCNTPVRDTYFFPHPQDCVAMRAPTVSSVAITTGAFTETDTRLGDLTNDGSLDGHQVVASKATCAPGQGEYCRQVFGIPDLDAYFTVTIPATENGNGIATIAEIRDSLSVLSDDQTTIPFTPYPISRDNSETVFVRALEEAGLSVKLKRDTCPPSADCIFGVSAIDPEVGSVVLVGSTVTVTVVGE